MRLSLLKRSISGLAIGAAIAVSFVPSAQAEEVNIYSYRQPFLIEPLLKSFTEATGIKTNVIYAQSGLVERIQAEAANSPADVLLTVDIGRLQGAVDAGVTQPVVSELLAARIPAELRDSDNHWFGLTVRGRVIYASRERVAQDQITYEELADPKWRGKICSRDGQHVYNVALIAAMIAHMGEEKAREWLAGVKENLSRKPTGNDRAQVQGIFSGECDLALGNTYYMAAMMLNDKEPEQKEWAASAKILFPNSQDRGTHVNVSGIALARHAPNRDAAIRLMEFLASDDAQRLYAEVNHEYPVNPELAPSDLVASWGTMKRDDIALSEVAKLRARASELVDEVGFNEGPSS
jgi:iron(III) transport system substrate-binding protein